MNRLCNFRKLLFLYFIAAVIYSGSLSQGVAGETIPPANFDFSTIVENSTLNIENDHDLQDKTIVLPPNVVLKYSGGRIINGSLLFNGGMIAGELLNPQLEIGGVATLINTTFLFDKNRWNITEGFVTDDIALINKNNLQKAIDDASSLGAALFQIADLDAYFQITSERNLILSFETSIRLPSDFTLQMSDNTNLRVQPNKHVRYNLLDIRDVENVTVTGGNLYGDREQHDYTPLYINGGGTLNESHEWGTLLNIATGINVRITNVKMAFSTGDGLNIHSTTHAFKPDYLGSNNIVISNCTLDSNRRNNISITDGYNIIVENNLFLNAGVDLLYSDGTPPRYGLDIEAVRERDEQGNLIEYQRARDIIIRNNTERGGANGAFIVAVGQHVIMEDNVVENTIGFSHANNVKIRNNTVRVRAGDHGIGAGHPQYSDTVYNNEVSGNTIISTGGIGASIVAEGTKMYGNSFNGCKTAIRIRNVEDAEVYNNRITSSEPLSYGIFTYSCFANKLTIRNNYINTTFKPIAFNYVNTEPEHSSYSVMVSNNKLYKGEQKAEVSISNSSGIIVNDFLLNQPSINLLLLSP